MSGYQLLRKDSAQCICLVDRSFWTFAVEVFPLYVQMSSPIFAINQLLLVWRATCYAAQA